MGDRIHTVIGYGFENVVFEKDVRFNPCFWNHRIDRLDEDEDTGDYTATVFERMIKINKRHFDETEGDHKVPDWMSIRDFRARIESRGWYLDEPSPTYHIVDKMVNFSGYATEMKKAPIVFVCPFSNWVRYDDIVDYYIFSSKKGPVEKTRLIVDEKGNSTGIYPHMNYVNRKTGKPVKCAPFERWGRNYTEQETQERFGLSLKEWKNDVVPEVPYIIRLFCEAADVFKIPNTVYDLRAMLYTYWC